MGGRGIGCLREIINMFNELLEKMLLDAALSKRILSACRQAGSFPFDADALEQTLDAMSASHKQKVADAIDAQNYDAVIALLGLRR